MMNVRTDNDVTMPHDDADRVAELLSCYANDQLRHAARTKSAAIRCDCERTAAEARKHARYIVERLWTWTTRESDPEKTPEKIGINC